MAWPEQAAACFHPAGFVLPFLAIPVVDHTRSLVAQAPLKPIWPFASASGKWLGFYRSRRPNWLFGVDPGKGHSASKRLTQS